MHIAISPSIERKKVKDVPTACSFSFFVLSFFRNFVLFYSLLFVERARERARESARPPSIFQRTPLAAPALPSPLSVERRHVSLHPSYKIRIFLRMTFSPLSDDRILCILSQPCTNLPCLCLAFVCSFGPAATPAAHPACLGWQPKCIILFTLLILRLLCSCVARAPLRLWHSCKKERKTRRKKDSIQFSATAAISSSACSITTPSTRITSAAVPRRRCRTTSAARATGRSSGCSR